MQFLAATEAQGERVDLKEAAVHVESHRSNVWRELKKLQTSGAWTELQGGAAKGSKGCGELLRPSEVDIRCDMFVSACWAALGVIGRRQTPDAGLLLHVVTAVQNPVLGAIWVVVVAVNRTVLGVNGNHGSSSPLVGRGTVIPSCAGSARVGLQWLLSFAAFGLLQRLQNQVSNGYFNSTLRLARTYNTF